MVKSTYGTGCFAVLNTGARAVRSDNKLLTTIAYRLDGRTTYALEGSIFIAGAAVQWLRDGLKVIDRADRSGALAAQADPEQNVILVPAFTGLGAPHWDPEARGALFGLTRATGAAELARAALEAVCFQTHDLLEAMRRDWPESQGENRFCASMAAWSPATGPCSALPTCSMPRSIGRGFWKPPRWELPGLRVAPPGSGRTSRASRRPGAAIAGSNPQWTRRGAAPS
jgi:hypothetical protein